MFVEVILPLPVAGTFTYSVDEKMISKIQEGYRVIVEFGISKLYTGIVESIHCHSPDCYYSIKPIIAILDKNPIVTHHQLKLWKFVSEYYCCSLGEVYRNIIPSVLKLESETFIQIRNNKNLDLSILDENETLILQSLLNKTLLKVKELEHIIPKKYLFSSLKFLYDERLIEINEKIIPKYKKKIIPYIKLSKELDENPDKLKQVFKELEQVNTQRELLLQFINIQNKNSKPISKKELLKFSHATPSVLKSLEKKKILESYCLFVDRIPRFDSSADEMIKLTEEQQSAYNQINKYFKTNNNVLLYGVTSSGKTEIYFHQIQNFIENQKKVLLLLPEGVITHQIIHRIQKLFGNNVGVYHSKLSINERVEVWMNCLENKYRIIVGTRSAIFLPLDELQLIIVDEEHDHSYKQNHIAPYYQCRDLVWYLSKVRKIPCLMGSATPSLETYYAAKTKKIGLVELKKRFNNVPLPEIKLISFKESAKHEKNFGEISCKLKQEIEKSLQDKNQVLIFINRRGFSSVLICNICGFVPMCQNCDVTLTYHKHSNDLKCHYCGYKENKINKCKLCNSLDIQPKGIGIQQIEENLITFFPGSRVERMDIDTMKKKGVYEKFLERMSLKEIDILVGTQMMSKGLNIDSINLIGVIKSDSLLYFPNFRASERAMQLLVQLSGRTGRNQKRGKMLLQTCQENTQFYQKIKNYDLESMYDEMIKERKNFSYPPFTRLIEITLKDKNYVKVSFTSKFLIKNLSTSIPSTCLLGPVEPEINKINNRYLNKILIKIPSTLSLTKTKKFIYDNINELKTLQETKSVLIIINVDPN